MKKIILLFSLLLIFFTGCTSDEDYIDTVKSITFEDGTTVKTYVQDQIKYGEFYILNEKELFDNGYSSLLMPTLIYIAPEEVLKELKNMKIEMPKDTPVVWKIEGNTDNGKILTASNGDIQVRIPTTKNGDYIEINTANFKVVNLKNNVTFREEQLESSKLYYEFLLKHYYE